MMQRVFSCLARLAVLTAAAAAVMALAGCAGAGVGGNKYTLHLDAYAEHVPYGKRFMVFPGVMDDKASDPKFIAAADSLAKAMERKGYIRASNIDEADLGIYLAYKVTEGKHAPFETFRPRTPGIAPEQLFFIDYTREFLVEAVDLRRYKAGDSKNVVWSIRVASKGPTGDINKAMPYVAAAVAQYMGSSGEHYVEVDSNFDIQPFKPAKHHNRP